MRTTIDELLSPAQAAELLHRHPRTLTRWANLGYGVQPIRLGRKLAYRRQDIERFLDDLAEDAANGHEGQTLADCIAEWNDRDVIEPAPAAEPEVVDRVDRPRGVPVAPAEQPGYRGRGFRLSTDPVARRAASEDLFLGVGEPIVDSRFQ